jgi:hypothetical protein
MSPEQWIRAEFTINNNLDSIDWGNGIFTPISVFLAHFGSSIETALGTGADIRQSMRDSDVDNKKGYNDLF